jgi:hypothetical protein
MKRDRLAMLGVVAAVVVALACLYVSQAHRRKASEIEEFVRERLGASRQDSVAVSRASGHYFKLNVVSANGGGMWVIVADAGTFPELITQGQDYPTCEPLEAAGVPTDLERYCWSPALEAHLMDRVTDALVKPAPDQGR